MRFQIGFKHYLAKEQLRNSWVQRFIFTKGYLFASAQRISNCVLEGFIDFLSLKQSSNTELQALRKDSDFLVLNSLAFVNKSLPILQKAKEVVMFLDNDGAGTQPQA